MLSINDKVISAQDISSKFKVFSNTSYLKAQKGSVAVCIESVTDWLSLCFYAKEAGLTVMPIHASTPESLAKKYADRAGCYALIYQTLDNVILFPYNETPDTAPGLIQMSSGTTGEPKSIKRSWRSINQEVSAYVSHFSAPNSMTPVIACPVTHSYGLICGILVGLARGKHPRVFTSINPKHLLKALLKLEQPLLYSSPLMIDTICMLWPNNSKLHAVMTSGTLMSGPVFERTKSKIKHFYQQYGCSEAGCVAISKTFDRANVIGEVLPHVTVKAGDNSKTPSEMVIKVKQPLDGQVSEIHTSDLGYFETIDGRRQLCFVARQDDTIIVSGLNVYPKDVEDIVLTHPHIKDAVLFKVKDHSTGYRAFLQFCAPHRYSDEDKAALRRWCHQHLATYQVPFDFVQVDAITRLPNGKVNRKAIAESYQLEAEVQAVTA
ncbi:AMP-binding protein [Alteromonas sp. HB246098]